MSLIHLLNRKGHVLLFCLLMAISLSSCTVKCDTCKCGTGGGAGIFGTWSCQKEPAPNGFKCKALYEGRQGCNNSMSNVCTTQTLGDGSTDCVCQPL